MNNESPEIDTAEVIAAQSIRIMELEQEVKRADIGGFSKGVAYCTARGIPVTWVACADQMPPPGVDVWVCDENGNVALDTTRGYVMQEGRAVFCQAARYDGVVFNKYNGVVAWAAVIKPPAPARNNETRTGG